MFSETRFLGRRRLPYSTSSVLFLAALSSFGAGAAGGAEDPSREACFAATPASGGAGVVTAINPAHGLVMTFSTEGVTLEPLLGERSAWTAGMTFAGIGRGDQLAAPSAADPVARGNRVEYHRGDVIEWYVNDPRGVEQGFTLARRPACAPSEEGESLRIALRMSGPLACLIDEDGCGLDFVDADGSRPLRFAKLVAWDAIGRTLDARMEPVGGAVHFVVDDSSAVYPVIVDPLATNPVWKQSTPTFAFDDGYGYSVATAGDVNGDGRSDILVGAPYHDGANVDQGIAYLYLSNGNKPVGTASWTTTIDQDDANIGLSVATAGDVNGDGYSDVIIGGNGRAQVFHGSATGLDLAASWTVTKNNDFGASVATAGDVNGDGYSDVIVGAPIASRAFVYLGSASGLDTAHAWTKAPSGIRFGQSVSTAGDVNGDGYSDVIVGAPHFGSFPNYTGKAFVYHGSANGLETTESWGKTSVTFFKYGHAVSTAGDVNGDGYSDVIVGVPEYTEGGGLLDLGKAYVYHGSANGVKSNTAWTYSPGQIEGHFGQAVSAAGDVNGDGYSDVIVGAPLFDTTTDDVGRAVIYRGSSKGLEDTAYWNEKGSLQKGYFGASVATAGDVNGDGYSDIIVGGDAYQPPWTGETGPRGQASVYLGGADHPEEAPGHTIVGGQVLEELGSAIAAGDLNGDGFADLVVGAQNHDGLFTDSGRVEVHLGGPDGFDVNPSWTGLGQSDLGRYGVSVAVAGDVNGDGILDLLVGEPRYSGVKDKEGKAHLYLGGVTGPSAIAVWTYVSDQDNARLGESVSTAGDVDGDGFSDILIGAPRYDATYGNGGRVYLFNGGSQGLASSPDWSRVGDDQNGRLGDKVSTAGDVNGDGFSDVIFAAPLWENSGETNEGRVELFHGSAFGLPSGPDWTFEGDQAGANLGDSISSGGDINGDGFSDVLVGASLYDDVEVDEGRLFIFHGSATGLTTPNDERQVDQAGARFGISVTTLGDVNGDGYSDLLVGASLYDDAVADEGGAWLYLGAKNGLQDDPSWSVFGAMPNDQLGWAVAAAGDPNGDGRPDLLIGSRFHDDVVVDAGGALLFHSNHGAGPEVRPQQLITNAWTPIAPLGLTSGAQMTVQANGRSAFGRGRVALEVEVARGNESFDAEGTFTYLSDFEDSGLDGYELKVAVGLLSAGPHRWRARVHYDTPGVSYQLHGPWFGADRPSHLHDVKNDLSCPGVVAAFIPYGVGKAGTNGVPTLSVTGTPSVGGEITIDIANGLPGAGLILFVGLAKVDLPFDGGSLLTLPLLTVNLGPLDANGAWTAPAPIPKFSGFCGSSLYLQSLFIDPGAVGPYQTAQTNGVELLFGG